MSGLISGNKSFDIVSRNYIYHDFLVIRGLLYSFVRVFLIFVLSADITTNQTELCSFKTNIFDFFAVSNNFT